MDHRFKHEEIVRIGDMLIESENSKDVAIAELYALSEDTGLSFKNVAGRLIRYLERLPLELRPRSPWVAAILQGLRDKGVYVHTSTVYPAWVPEGATG